MEVWLLSENRIFRPQIFKNKYNKVHIARNYIEHHV